MKGRIASGMDGDGSETVQATVDLNVKVASHKSSFEVMVPEA